MSKAVLLNQAAAMKTSSSDTGKRFMGECVNDCG
jgi:hypothetical protein